MLRLSLLFRGVDFEGPSDCDRCCTGVGSLLVRRPPTGIEGKEGLFTCRPRTLDGTTTTRSLRLLPPPAMLRFLLLSEIIFMFVGKVRLI